MNDEELHASFLRSERYKETATERFGRQLEEEGAAIPHRPKHSMHCKPGACVNTCEVWLNGGFDPTILASAMHFGSGFAKRPVGQMDDDELEYIVRYRNGEISG